MNWFDILIGICLLVSIYNGYKKGFVFQIVKLATVILAAIFGGQLAQIILPELTKQFTLQPNVAVMLSYAVAFAIISIAVYYLGKMIMQFIRIIHLTFVNRVLGAVVAAGTAMFILSIFLNLALMVDKNQTLFTSDIRQNSIFFASVESVVPAVVPYLNQEVWEKYVPEGYRHQIESKTDSLQVAPKSVHIDSLYQGKFFDVD